MTLARPTVLWIAALAIAVVAVVLLREILLPFVAGIALAYLLDPLVNRLHAIGVNRALAAAGIIGLFYIGLAVTLIVTIPVVGAEVATLIDMLPEYVGQLQDFIADPKRPWLRKLIGQGLVEAQQSAGQLAGMAADWIPTVLRSIWSNTRALLSIFSLLVVTPIVTFYLLKDWNRLIAVVDHSIPAAHRESFWKLAQELHEMISGFLRGQGTICVILALYYALALRLIGLNHSALIGLGAGLIGFIPYLGFLTGLVVSLFVAVLQFWPSWTSIPLVLGIFAVGQTVADYVLAPYLIGPRIHLGPVWIMFAITAFGYLFGFVGLLVAVPLAAAIRVIIRFAVTELLAAPPQTAPPVAPPLPSELAPSRKSWLKTVLWK